MDLDQVKELYNACDPGESLSVEDPRNVDLDAVADGEPRGSVWASQVARQFELSTRPVYKLLSGLPGSGKSTELRRLLATLETNGLRGVLVDADAQLDLTNRIDVPEIVAVLVSEIEKAVLVRERKDPATALKDGYPTRIWNFLKRTEVDIKSTVLSAGPIKIGAELKANPTVREQFRSIIEPRLTAFLDEARDYVKCLEERAKDRGCTRIVVAFDSLEKLRGTSTSWDAVIDSAERVFAGQAEHVRLGVHTIFTVPTALLSRRLEIEFMPAVKVRERSGSVHPPGVSALREVVRQRIPDEFWDELFGSGRDQLRRIERIIDNSGGYLRNLVSALRDIVAAEKHPIDDDFVSTLFQRRVDEYKRILTKADYSLLEAIAIEKDLIPPDADPETHRRIEHMLANNVVLRYQNTNDWFDLHPAVKEVPGLRERLPALEERR